MGHGKLTSISLVDEYAFKVWAPPLYIISLIKGGSRLKSINSHIEDGPSLSIKSFYIKRGPRIKSIKMHYKNGLKLQYTYGWLFYNFNHGQLRGGPCLATISLGCTVACLIETWEQLICVLMFQKSVQYHQKADNIIIQQDLSYSFA